MCNAGLSIYSKMATNIFRIKPMNYIADIVPNLSHFLFMTFYDCIKTIHTICKFLFFRETLTFQWVAIKERIKI